MPSIHQTIEIRRATKADAATISLLARITFDQAFGHLFRDRQDLLDYFERTFSVDKINRSFEQENNVFWLALVDKLPVGYGKLKRSSSSPFVAATQVAQLQKIYILKDFLSLKIGFQLQEMMLEEAKMQHATYIWLSVYDGNARAIRFYGKTGWALVGEHEYSIGKEDFGFRVMSKKLSE